MKVAVTNKPLLSVLYQSPSRCVTQAPTPFRCASRWSLRLIRLIRRRRYCCAQPNPNHGTCAVNATSDNPVQPIHACVRAHRFPLWSGSSPGSPSAARCGSIPLKGRMCVAKFMPPLSMKVNIDLSELLNAARTRLTHAYCPLSPQRAPRR